MKSKIPPSIKYVIWTGNKVLDYSKKERKSVWSTRIIVRIKTMAEQTRESSCKTVYIYRILPRIDNKDNHESMVLLKSLSIFATRRWSEIMINKVFTPNEWHGYTRRFKEITLNNINRQLKRKAFQVLLEGDVPSGEKVMGVASCWKAIVLGLKRK